MTRALPLTLLLLTACLSDQENAPCTEVGECLPGFRCVEAVCVACEGTDACQPIVPTEIGPVGGAACTESACITVPSNALDAYVTFTVAEVSGETPSLSPLSAVLEVGPMGTTFSTPAEVSIAVTTTLTSSQFGVYRSSSQAGPWELLNGASEVTTAKGLTDSVAFFVAAKK